MRGGGRGGLCERLQETRTPESLTDESVVIDEILVRLLQLAFESTDTPLCVVGATRSEMNLQDLWSDG